MLSNISTLTSPSRPKSLNRISTRLLHHRSGSANSIWLCRRHYPTRPQSSPGGPWALFTAVPLFPGHASHATPSLPPHQSLAASRGSSVTFNCPNFIRATFFSKSHLHLSYQTECARYSDSKEKKTPTSLLSQNSLRSSQSPCYQTGVILPTPVLFTNASREDPSRTSPVPNCLLRATNPDKSSSVIRIARSVNLVLGFPRSVLRHSYLARRL